MWRRIKLTSNKLEELNVSLNPDVKKDVEHSNANVCVKYQVNELYKLRKLYYIRMYCKLLIILLDDR